MVETVSRSIQKREFPNTKNVRHYTIDIDNEVVIELRGITDLNWKRYEPLLDMLRTTRKQTESGELQRTSLPFEEVEKFFPNVSRTSIFRLLNELNGFLNPSGWSVERETLEGKKIRNGGIPFDAPWYLSGPDDNVVQNKKQSKLPKKVKIFDKDDVERTIAYEQREIAKKRLDRLAFATDLLQYCTSNLAYLNDKASKDPIKIMKSLLPTGVGLEDIIGKKTPQECFQELIQEAINSMVGKTKKELPEKQKPIYDFWNTIRIDYGQHPKTVIFENFSEQESNDPLDQVKDEDNHEEEVVVEPSLPRRRGRPKKYKGS